MRPDTEWGAFTPMGPWIAREGGSYLASAEARRAESRELALKLRAPRRFPPMRAVPVALRLLLAIAPYLWQKRSGRVAAQERLAARLRRTAARLGPAYVKLAQIIASGEGLFPAALVHECARLRDQAEHEPFDQVRAVIEDALGSPLGEVFATFEPSPLAAASIAQVHAATLLDGTPAVVKVQRPMARQHVERDLAALAWLAPWLVGRIPVTALANPPALISVFADTIVEELDFCLEAASMIEVAKVLRAGRHTGTVVVPRPHPDLVFEKVLVMERLSGVSVTDAEGIAACVEDGAAVIRTIADTLLEGALIRGVFHGDLHPGNLMVLESGAVALLDFGIVERFTPAQRKAFLALVLHAASGNWRGQIRALQELGAVPVDADVEDLGEELGLDGPPVDPATMDPTQLTEEMQRLAKALLGSGASLPRALMLWAKNLVLLDQSVAVLDPAWDLIGELQSLVQRFAVTWAPELQRELGEAVIVTTEGIATALALPPGTDRMTWQQMRARRELIANRMRNRE